MDIHIYNVKSLPNRERLFDVCCDKAPQRVVGIDWDNLTVSAPVTDTLGIDQDNLTVSAPVTDTQYKHICMYTLHKDTGRERLFDVCYNQEQ